MVLLRSGMGKFAIGLGSRKKQNVTFDFFQIKDCIAA